MKVIVQFSGGKDSQACLIKAVNDYGKNNVTAIFCDTGWEHPSTYDHIKYVVENLGVQLITLRNEKVGSFQNLCKQMKCFPVASRRACTSVLKIEPMIDWVVNQNDSLIIIQGIRAMESKSRSEMLVDFQLNLLELKLVPAVSVTEPNQLPIEPTGIEIKIVISCVVS